MAGDSPFCLVPVIRGRRTLLNTTVEVEVNLRPTVSRSVCPGVRLPSGTRDQFFFLLEISFRLQRILTL
jgi:hypothetical protein